MNLKIRDHYKYAVACPTSMGVRITPDDRMAVHNSTHFYMQATSAESNLHQEPAACPEYLLRGY